MRDKKGGGEMRRLWRLTEREGDTDHEEQPGGGAEREAEKRQKQDRQMKKRKG